MQMQVLGIQTAMELTPSNSDWCLLGFFFPYFLVERKGDFINSTGSVAEFHEVVDNIWK